MVELEAFELTMNYNGSSADFEEGRLMLRSAIFHKAAIGLEINRNFPDEFASFYSTKDLTNFGALLLRESKLKQFRLNYL